MFSPPNQESNPSATHYRALCVPAVLSIVVGVLSIPILVFWTSWFWAVVPLLGVWLGWKAQQKILAAPTEWTGLQLAKIGLWLSVAMWILGYGWLILDRGREIPYGYDRISYEQLQPDPNVPTDPIPQSAHDMQDKRVFVRGYMQPRRQQSGIKEFILCPANGECPFCIPNPKKTEMIRIVMQGDMETMYTTRQIGVGGRFQVDPQDPSGVPYAIEADCLR